MSQSIVAYRYAKSLIDLATETGVINEVNKDMDLFISVCQENDQLVAVLKNPIVRHSKKLAILKALFLGKVHDVTFSIFTILTKKNRESYILSIAQEFRKLYNLKNNIQVATVSTVEPLSDTQKSEFISKIAQALNKEIILNEKIDSSLIGGYVLTVNDTQIDTSVKKRLADMRLSFS
ncbi:MAG: ATP synthase F1 subunit delta [Spirosomataceae bacterium]